MDKLWFDTETFSHVPIKYGTYRYAESAEIMIISYAINDQEAKVIDLTEHYDMTAPEARRYKYQSVVYTFPMELIQAMADPEVEVWAHNSMFDRTVCRYQTEWEKFLSIKRWRDTMVQAYAHSLPGGLGELCQVLNVDSGDSKTDGRSLIQLFCKPRSKNTKLRRATRHTHPEEWEKFKEYAKQDIPAMRACHYKMPKWNYPNNPRVLAEWHLDQKINDRGFRVDTELTDAAVHAVELEKLRLKKVTQDMTEGELSSTTRRDKLIEYVFEQYGIHFDNTTKATMAKAIEDPDIPEPLRELIKIRLQATATSTSKYKALRNATSADGRCRGTIQFMGAMRTGRDAGRVFQPQNLPSRGILESEETEFGIDQLKDGTQYDWFDNIMALCTSAVRGCLIADEGNTLAIADLSNIEGRFSAWICREDWKLRAFREFDEGRGDDLYKLAYSKAFRVEPSEVAKFQRNIGKVFELMLGYEGGVGAFLTGALGYGFDIADLTDKVWPTLPKPVFDEAAKFCGWMLSKGSDLYGLTEQEFIACDSLKRLWRNSNPMIASSWKELNSLCVTAINRPGTTYTFRDRVQIRRDGAWLRIRLPSGRMLCYPSVQLENKRKNWSYMGRHQFTRKWVRIHASGGKTLENIVQAGSRDILFANMFQAEREGFEINLRVHDELVSNDKKMLTSKRLSEIMSSNPAWSEGLPLAAAGFDAKRYRK